MLTVVVFTFGFGALYATVQFAKLLRPLSPLKVSVVALVGIVLQIIALAIVLVPVLTTTY